MTPFWNTLTDIFSRFDVRSGFDILIIAALIYSVLLLLRGTTAMSLLRGAVILLIIAVLAANVFNLRVLSYLLTNSLTAVLIGIPIIFQPEIRRGLERLGRTGARTFVRPTSTDQLIDTVVTSALQLAAARTGALVVLERETGLQDYIDTGHTVDAVPSVPLLTNIFFHNAPMHDGALIMRDGRIAAASCVLPLSETSAAAGHGTRHRAAVGLTERTDAVAVVVSEETGGISVAVDGRLFGGMDEHRLRAVITNALASRGRRGRRPAMDGSAPPPAEAAELAAPPRREHVR